MCSFWSLPGLNGVLLSQIALVEIMMTPRNIKQSQQCLQHALDRFSAACHQAKIKISTERPSY